MVHKKIGRFIQLSSEGKPKLTIEKKKKRNHLGKPRKREVSKVGAKGRSASHGVKKGGKPVGGTNAQRQKKII